VSGTCCRARCSASEATLVHSRLLLLLLLVGVVVLLRRVLQVGWWHSFALHKADWPVVLLVVLLGQLARKIALSSPRSLDSDSVEEEERDTVEEDSFR